MPTALAIAAHPDDIEFVMAGTLLRLAETGWSIHYFNIANGCCGSKIFQWPGYLTSHRRRSGFETPGSVPLAGSSHHSPGAIPCRYFVAGLSC